MLLIVNRGNLNNLTFVLNYPFVTVISVNTTLSAPCNVNREELTSSSSSDKNYCILNLDSLI